MAGPAVVRVLIEHLETLVAQARGPDGAGPGLPAYVERELRAVVSRGDPLRQGSGQAAAGFIWARCCSCGHDVLVPLSCKSHLCPSCATARMERHVGHLTERVLPAAPLRLWTVSFPFDLRLLLAAGPVFLSCVHGAFVRRALACLERKGRARELALCQGGAVSFIQLFDASGPRQPPLPHPRPRPLPSLRPTFAPGRAPPAGHSLDKDPASGRRKSTAAHRPPTTS